MNATKTMPVQLLSFRAVRKGALRGFASVQIGALKINDITIFHKDGRTWASMPSKPRIGRDGQPVMKAGKPSWQSICEWASKDSSDRFSESLVAEIRAEEPNAIEPDNEQQPGEAA